MNLFLLCSIVLLTCSAHTSPSTVTTTPEATYTVQLDDWGDNSVRVRIIAGNGPVGQFPGALSDKPPKPPNSGPVIANASNPHVSKINGNIQVSAASSGTIGVYQYDIQTSILASYILGVPPEGKKGGPAGIQVNGNFRTIFGFGEHQLQFDSLNLLGKYYDMESCLEYEHAHGGEICVPFTFNTLNNPNKKGDTLFNGFFWNMPGYGSVDFNLDDFVSWNVDNAVQIDFWVTAPPSKLTKQQQVVAIMQQYSDAIGRTPPMPEAVGGYWHSKNRYKTQKELLAAAAEFHQRKIPVDVIVIDYLHWKYFGDWSFDPQYWPDPQAMVDTIASYNMQIMVSVWPFTSPHSRSYTHIRDNKLCALNSTGEPSVWPDGLPKPPAYLYDPTQQIARDYVWSLLKSGYYKYGIKIFWLDAAEPETMQGSPKGDSYSLGGMDRMGMMFPYYHVQTVYDGLTSEGVAPDDIIMLARSGWAGSPKFGSAVWSGDTHSAWDVLHTSVLTMQNAELSGLYWWTTDIGGYSGGDPSADWFQELIIRWFQFGVTNPLFRQHGARNTEPWLLHNATYKIVVDIIKMRYTIKDYVLSELKNVSNTGTPFNRPLWFEFPDDEDSWYAQYEYMMGSKYLVAPVTEKGQKSKKVYFPPGTWKHYFTNQMYDGNKNYTVGTPINVNNFPLFEKMS